MNKPHPLVMLLACMFVIESINAQDSTSRADQFVSFPSRFLKKVNDNASRLENKIFKKTDKAIKQLSKEESRIKKKIYKKDSVAAMQFFQDPVSQYKSLHRNITEKVSKSKSKEYIPFLDTLTTSLQFLEKNTALHNSSSVQQSLLHINKMKDQFQMAKEIQRHLQSRHNQLREQLSKLNMLNELKQYNKKLYYYQVQLEEYRTLFKEPDRLTRKAIDLLSKTKPFQDFITKHSLLASLFPQISATNNLASQAGLPGLQSSAQVSALIQQTAGGGPNALQAIQSNIQQSQSQLQQIKNKVNAMGQNGDENDMPNFRPNNQRTKSFWNRWELGTNLQSSRSNAWLPSATQIGLSAGYKLNDRSIVGIGMAGSIGWGKEIKHIVVSYEGVSARSFVDWKLKGSFWLTAGYEMNYRSAFNRIEQLQILNDWQYSGLVGVSKKYRIGKKIKGNLALLYDYLSYSQIPVTQPIIFRFGYTLK